MEHRLVVRVHGVGLGWADELADLLHEGTSLPWKRDTAREQAESGPAQGVEAIILEAVIAAAADDAAKALLSVAKQKVQEWRERRLTPPEVTIEIETDGDGPDAPDPGTVSESDD